MTSVSISTRPKIRMKRIAGAAPGFREMPSQALDMALAWQNAPMAAAITIIAEPRIREIQYRDALAGLRSVC